MKANSRDLKPANEWSTPAKPSRRGRKPRTRKSPDIPRSLARPGRLAYTGLATRILKKTDICLAGMVAAMTEGELGAQSETNSHRILG